MISEIERAGSRGRIALGACYLYLSVRKRDCGGGRTDPEGVMFKFGKEGWEIHIFLYAGSCFINGDIR